MNRRDLLAVLGGAAVGWPRAVQAQQPALPVVGSLALISPAFALYFPMLKKGVSDLGFDEGKAVLFDYRWDKQVEGLPAIAADLVARRASVLVTLSGTPTAFAAKNATNTIPIIFLLGSDPVKLGLVSSLNKPNANITGVSLFAPELMQKQLEMVSDILPPGAPVGVLIEPNSDAAEMEGATRSAASMLHRIVVFVEAASEDAFEPALQELQKQHAAGLVIPSAAVFNTHHQQLAALAAKYALPTVYADGDLAVSGGLMKYGPDLPTMFRQLGHYVGKILAGAKPGDLPIERPERIELKINLKTAKTLGLTIPPTLLIRADEVIE
jgi:putative ABC transport system substrate-binding protein